MPFNFLFYLKHFPQIVKKIFIISLVFFAVIQLFFYFIGQDKLSLKIQSQQSLRYSIYAHLKDPELNKTKEGKLSLKLYRGAMCAMVGEACTDNPQDADKLYNKSLFGRLTSFIVLPYNNPPASGITWVSKGLENAGLFPHVYAAQGLGFASISPLINLWKIFRDIAYMVLVVILIVIGFMIMFRMKLNPQTIITVENALPRIVISLILITFSFAIAGFLIDLMYVVIAISISVLSRNNNFFNATQFQNNYLNADFGTIFNSMFPSKSPLGGIAGFFSVGQAMENILPVMINQLLRFILGAITGVVAVNILSGPINGLAGIGGHTLDGADGSAIASVGIHFPSLGEAIAFIVAILLYGLALTGGFALGYTALGLVISLLILMTIVLMLFRIFFLLFSTYIRILLMIVFSPLFMLAEALPGKNAFGYWLKNLTMEIMTFPLVIIFFVIAYIIVNTTASPGGSTTATSLWQPPFLSDVDPNAFTVLLGFGIMFMIPDLIKMVKELFGAKGLPLSIGLGTFFGGAAAGISGAMTGAGMFTSLTQMPFIGTALKSRIMGDPDKPNKLYTQIFGYDPLTATLRKLNEKLK